MMTEHIGEKEGMPDKAIAAEDVLVDLTGLSLESLPDSGDSCLLRAVRRILKATDESDVIAEWNNG